MNPSIDTDLTFHHEWLNLPNVYLYKQKIPIYYIVVEKTGIFKNDFLCVAQLMIKNKPCTVTAFVENAVLSGSQTTYRINSKDFFSFEKYFHEKIPVRIKERFPYLLMMSHMNTTVKGFSSLLDGSFISINQESISKDGPSALQFEYIYNTANFVYNAEVEYQRYKNSRFGKKIISYIKEQQRKKKSELGVMDYYRIARICLIIYRLSTGSSSSSDSGNDIAIPDDIDFSGDNYLSQIDNNIEVVDYLSEPDDPTLDLTDSYNDDPYMDDSSFQRDSGSDEDTNVDEESNKEISFTGATRCTLCNCGHYIGGDAMSDFCACGHVKKKHVWG